MEVGAEMFEQGNIYYASVQQAVKANIPDSKPVFENFRVRYGKHTRRRGGDPAAA